MNTIYPTNFYAMEQWRNQYSPVLWQAVHTETTVPKWGMSHPLEAGFVASIGEAAGQRADCRLPLDDGREVHMREYGDYYTLHWDHVSAVRNPLGHLFSDAPHWIVVGLIGLLFLVLIWGNGEES